MKGFLLSMIIIFLAAISYAGQASSTEKIVVKAVKVTENIKIDGILSETVWQTENFTKDFTQRDPDEGKEPTEPTEVYVAYDNEALYIGARLYDTSPDSIIARLARRDDMIDADWFGVFLDPYYDRRSGFYFAVNAGGTIADGVLYNDDWDDDSWDGVWEAKSDVNGKGWTAEMKIPFSQLRFHEEDEIVWGINIRRDIGRKNEIDYLVYVPKNESGFVSHFADLVGIKNINPSGQIEILPYVTARAEYKQFEDGDPFNDGSKYIPGTGVDLKMGLGSNLTLNATINPDFGQVEIDPAVINLSDVETFYSEKRPFFVEGSTIFDFGYGGARNYWGFNWSGPDFFYSRRIGRNPQGSLPDYDYVDSPEGTHILGAAKLSGKIGDWNVGAIQAVTQREYAEIQYEGAKRDVEVEPLSYYGIIRGQNEFNKGDQGLGFISTYTIRDFKDQRLRDEINKSAYTFGVDGWTFLDSSKTWVMAGWAGMSNLQGTKEQITSIQTNSRHYFQRPDSKTNRLDSSATQLTGYAGRLVLNRQKGNFFFNSAFGFISPGFDVNDVGFLYRADVLNMHVGAGYSWTEPTDYYHYAELGGAAFRSYDFDGNIVWEGLFHFGYYQFPNYYSINWNLAYNPETINNRRTRGGPLSLNTPGYQINLSSYSDSRKDWVAGLGFFTYQQSHSYEWEFYVDFTLRPASNISISLSPFFNINSENSQWVDKFDDPYATSTYGARYVFANMYQRTAGAGIRLNWTFTPQLSLQLYVQPLIASGDYTGFKELAAPLTYDFNKYGEGNSTFDEENHIADPDGSGPAQPIEIGNPDFNFKSLRGNAVLRWEYLPGSVLYLVWTQSRSDFEEIGEFKLGRSFGRLADAQPDNIFMIKFNYWFNI